MCVSDRRRERDVFYRIKPCIYCNLMSILHLLLHPQSFHSDHISLLHLLLFILRLVFSLADINQVSGMETLTLLVCHICLYLKPFPLFFHSFAERAPEKHRRGKPLESVIQPKMSAHHHPPPPHLRLPLQQLSRVRLVY